MHKGTGFLECQSSELLGSLTACTGVGTRERRRDEALKAVGRDVTKYSQRPWLLIRHASSLEGDVPSPHQKKANTLETSNSALAKH